MKKTVNYLVIMSCFTLGATLAYADTDAHHGKMHDTQASHHGEMHGKDSHHGKRHGKKFRAMDTNADGAITKEEFDAYHAMKFKKMDVNGDGEITLGDIKSKSKEAEVGHASYYKVGQ